MSINVASIMNGVQGTAIVRILGEGKATVTDNAPLPTEYLVELYNDGKISGEEFLKDLADSGHTMYIKQMPS